MPEEEIRRIRMECLHLAQRAGEGLTASQAADGRPRVDIVAEAARLYAYVVNGIETAYEERDE